MFRLDSHKPGPSALACLGWQSALVGVRAHGNDRQLGGSAATGVPASLQKLSRVSQSESRQAAWEGVQVHYMQTGGRSKLLSQEPQQPTMKDLRCASSPRSPPPPPPPATAAHHFSWCLSAAVATAANVVSDI